MNRCPGEETLMDALEGDESKVREHLGECPTCARRLDRARSAARALRGEPPAAVSPPRPRGSRFALAAALAILASLVWILTRPPRPLPPPPVPAQEADPAVARHIRDLAHEDPDVRDRARKALLEAGERAKPALLEALSSKDPEVRGRARDILDTLLPRFEPSLTIPSVAAFSFSPDGASLAHFPADNRLEVVRADSGKPAWVTNVRLRLEKRVGPGVAYSLDGSILYAESETGTIGVWDAANGTSRRKISPKPTQGDAIPPLRSIAALPGGELLVNTELGALVLLNDKAYTLAPFPYVVASADGARVVGVKQVPGGTLSLYTYSPRTWKALSSAEIRSAAPGPWAMTAPKDLSRLYLSSRPYLEPPKKAQGTEEVVVVNGASLTEESRLQPSPGAARVTCLTVSPDGRWLAVGLTDGDLKIYRTRDLERVETLKFEKAPTRAAMTDDARLVGVQTGQELRLFRRR